MMNLAFHETMDIMGFIRDHVKHSFTALKEFNITINDKTNIEALAEILARSPKASSFTLTFPKSSFGVQKMAETCWKVLLSIFYCNTNDKTVMICLEGTEENDDVQLENLDWSFAKEAKYKQYRNVQNPGTVKELEFAVHSYPQVFYTAPIWNHLSIEHLTTPLVYSFEGQLSNIAAKCVVIQVNFE